jgi:hypothetical protein
MNRKAQSQIITTVLIILLVLAAIVIVWQVVNSTIKGGAEQIDKQSTCLGISMEVTATSATTATVKRIGGNTLTGTTVVYTEGGTTTQFPDGDTNAGLDDYNDPMASQSIAVPASTSIEVALKLSDGTVCPISGTATTPAS